MLRRTVVDAHASRGHRCHGVVGCLKPVHAKQHVAQEAPNAYHEIYQPDETDARGQLWLKLRLERPCGLGSKHPYAAAASSHGRYERYHREHYAQASYPLGKRSPKEYAMGQGLNIVDDSGTRRGESRHRLKIGIRETANVAAKHKGQRGKERIHDPHERHHEIGIATREAVGGIAP